MAELGRLDLKSILSTFPLIPLIDLPLVSLVPKESGPSSSAWIWISSSICTISFIGLSFLTPCYALHGWVIPDPSCYWSLHSSRPCTGCSLHMESFSLLSAWQMANVIFLKLCLLFHCVKLLCVSSPPNVIKTKFLNFKQRICMFWVLLTSGLISPTFITYLMLHTRDLLTVP